GNWDTFQLEEMAERLGCELRIDAAVETEAKRHVRDDMGSLSLVRYLRNRLAHGDMAFEECGDGVSVADLRLLKERTENYLRQVVLSFAAFIEEGNFLLPERRPYIGEGI